MFAQAYTARVEPLRDEMRRVRAAFLAELDAAHARGGLNKTEAATLSELICDIAEAMIRKLASALHPDRATDAADQAEKTAYMQRVNQAYAAGDLLALMQLQLEIEQVDRSQITAAPPERVRRFNKLLAEQLEEIEEEIVAREMHLCMHYGLVQEWRLNPMRLNDLIDGQVQEFEVGLFQINRDRAALGDQAGFKHWLKQVRRERQADFF